MRAKLRRIVIAGTAVLLLLVGLPTALAVTAGPAGAAPTLPSALHLTMTMRDFLYRGTTVPGPGHPDFESFGCGFDYGLVAPTLGADHAPTFGPNGGSCLTSATSFCWWFHDTGCAGAGSTNPYDQVVPGTLTLNQVGTSSTYQFASSNYFPLDGQGWNAPSFGAPQVNLDCNGGGPHNFSYTEQSHAVFTYDASTTPTLTMTSDDDGWVFINNRLAIDLGGVHGPTTGSVTLDAAHATALGLTNGQQYPVDIFHAERHTCGSALALTTSLPLNPPPVVTVGGVTDGATYALGDVPTATCSVTSIDGSPAVTPVLSTPSNGDGTGQQTATCSYTDSAGQTGTAAATYTIVAPQLTGRAYGLAASAHLGSATLLNVRPTPDTGAVATTASSSVAPPCVLSIAGLAGVKAVCANVTTSRSFPAGSSASASIAAVTIGLRLLPVITLQAVQSSSSTSCAGSSGDVTIAYLKVGTRVLISKPTAIKPNTKITVGVVHLVLNEQTRFTAPDHGLLVNAVHLSVNALGHPVVNAVLASSESDIGNCP